VRAFRSARARAEEQDADEPATASPDADATTAIPAAVRAGTVPGPEAVTEPLHTIRARGRT
jgi:hypothetical protein